MTQDKPPISEVLLYTKSIGGLSGLEIRDQYLVYNNTGEGIETMSFGPIMKFSVDELHIELAPLTKESVAEFISGEFGGGMQRWSVFRYIGLSTAPTLEDELEWYEKVRVNKTSIVWGIWLIEENNGAQTRTLIGNSALTGLGQSGAEQFRRAESGSLIFRKEYWGRGIASAAHKARTWYAFQHLGIHYIKSAVLRSNGGSRKALERSGYTFVYTKRNERYGDGVFEHLDHLECLNPLPFYWATWWHGDRPSKAQLRARQLTTEALEWASKHVELA